MIPDSTSPAPAVASQGGAEALIAARPSGAAMIGVGALQQHHGAGPRGGGAGGGQPVGPGGPKTRANSPACGVSTAAPRKASGSPAKAENDIGVGHHGALRGDQHRQGRAGRRPAPRPGPQTQTWRRVSCSRSGRGASLTSRPGEPAR